MDNIRFTFLYIDLYSMGRTWAYPESAIPYNMFRYIVKGRAVFCIDGKNEEVKENEIVYIPSGCRMSCYSLTDTFEFFSIRFTTSVLYETEDVLDVYYGIPRIMENQGEDVYFKEMYKWVKTDHIAKKCFIRGYLDLLIGSLAVRGKNLGQSGGEFKGEVYDLEKIKKRELKTNQRGDPRIMIVMDYIVLHPTEKYTPEKMANMVDLSKQRFSSLFKANTGKTPMEYVREVRLTAAARRLLTSNENINDVAFAVGYEDANYFIREFKAAFGYTPNQYRKVARE